MLISTPYFNMAFTRVALHDSQLEIILFFNLIPGVSAAHQFILSEMIHFSSLPRPLSKLDSDWPSQVD